ncbi:MAG: methyltransferase domain-containing protein [bacterium]
MVDFSKIASSYAKNSLVQRPAAETLLNLLEIKEHDDILDIGCGVGNLTRKIRELSKGRVVGIDPSEKMIAEARSRQADITFHGESAETMDYHNCFDVIFCNSAFQWFRNPQKALLNCFNALRKNGRIGIQSPAKRVYCPHFIGAIDKVTEDPRTRDIFACFREPWIFFETAEEYTHFFENAGFKVSFSKIETINTKHTPEEVFAIFSSGAIAGYLNQEFYDTELSAGYEHDFLKIIKEAFEKQADSENRVELQFNRIYLTAQKE